MKHVSQFLKKTFNLLIIFYYIIINKIIRKNKFENIIFF